MCVRGARNKNGSLVHCVYIFVLSKGLGSTAPDSKDQKVLEDGTVVPMGKGVQSDVKNTSLLYNEYPFEIAACLLQARLPPNNNTHHACLHPRSFDIVWVKA